VAVARKGACVRMARRARVRSLVMRTEGIGELASRRTGPATPRRHGRLHRRACSHNGDSDKRRASCGRPRGSPARNESSAPEPSRGARAGLRSSSSGPVVESSRSFASRYQTSWSSASGGRKTIADAHTDPGILSHRVLQSHLSPQVRLASRCKGFLPVRFTGQSFALHRKRYR
jgi:hypothetical protein